MMPILMGLEGYFIVVLICIFLTISGVEHLFMCLLTICISFDEMSIQVLYLLLVQLGHFLSM